MEDLEAYNDICLDLINATQRSAVLCCVITLLHYYITTYPRVGSSPQEYRFVLVMVYTCDTLDLL
jgi:hypothetical protein